MKLCECGCGGELKRKTGRFVSGHNQRKEVYMQIPTAYRKLLTEDELHYLKNHYKHLSRQKLAKKFGLQKVIFNLICMELKLDRGA